MPAPGTPDVGYRLVWAKLTVGLSGMSVVPPEHEGAA